MGTLFRPLWPKRRLVNRFLRLAVFTVAVSGLALLAIAATAYVEFSEDLPELESIADYNPPTATRVFSSDRQLIGEFFRERRVLVPFERIPTTLIQAVLAAEDDRFFEHAGLDFLGITRAAIANLKAGRIVQGGSTITQQVAKSLLISAEGYEKGSAKKLSRKIKEAILARRLEESLSKQDILSVYLNQVFLGNQSYGVQAASETYFRKNVQDLNLAEAALLAGLPQAPSRYSPFRFPDRARRRRQYVLRRMHEEGFVSLDAVAQAEAMPIRVHEARDISRAVTPHFTEHVRKQLVERFGSERVLTGGLRVYTTVDVERDRAAQDSVGEHLRTVDKRQGFLGALRSLATLTDRIDFIERQTDALAQAGELEELEDGKLYAALVDRMDRSKQQIYLRIGPHLAVLPLAAMRWARKIDPNISFGRGLLRRLPKTIRPGDVLLVRTTTRARIRNDSLAKGYFRTVPQQGLVVALEQQPKLEAALLSVEVKTGYVTAMVGGYDFGRSEFNRTLQSCRQPGSSFKPLVYAAALDLLGWTASTTVLDAPLTFDDVGAGRRWKPSNFGQTFQGEVTLRTALQNSMNIPAIRVLDAVGLAPAIGYAARLGITSDLPAELGLALGSGCVVMGDLVEAYRTFAGYGRRSKRRFITQIVDRHGNLVMDEGHPSDRWASLERKASRGWRTLLKPDPEVIDPQSAFLITKLMRNVVEGGTGAMAKRLGLPVAGKTGTTNDSFDAWFVGYTTELATAVWVGYDDYVTPMGKEEQGGRAALPMWLGYMGRAKAGGSRRGFRPPPGIVFARIDPKTGLLARRGSRGVREAYRRGSQPREFAARAGAVRSDELFLEDHL